MKRSLSVFLPALALGLMTSLAPVASASEPTACQIHCGPAPCCMILWVTFCGCPWGEEQTLLAQGGASQLPAAAASCTVPQPASLLDTPAAGD